MKAYANSFNLFNDFKHVKQPTPCLLQFNPEILSLKAYSLIKKLLKTF